MLTNVAHNVKLTYVAYKCLDYPTLDTMLAIVADNCFGHNVNFCCRQLLRCSHFGHNVD